MEIGQRLDGLTGTGGRQRQTQAKRRDDALAATKLRLGATGIEQRFRKHPLELVSHHAKLSVIHRGLLSWSPKPHIQQEFRMDRKKNPQQIKYLKVPTYECRFHFSEQPTLYSVNPMEPLSLLFGNH